MVINDTTHEEELVKLDKFFKPDIQVILDDNCNILGYQAFTTAGEYFILHNSLLEKKYDDIDFMELCVESMFESEVEQDTLDNEENQ